MSEINLFIVGDSISMQYGPWLARYCADVYNVQRKGDLDIDPRSPSSAKSLGAYGQNLREIAPLVRACSEHIYRIRTTPVDDAGAVLPEICGDGQN